MHLGFLRLSAFAVFLLVSSDVADSARGVLRGWSTRLEREAQEVLDSSDPWRNPLHSGAAPPWFRDMPPAALASIAQAKRKAAEEKKKTALKEFQSSLSVEVAAQVGRLVGRKGVRTGACLWIACYRVYIGHCPLNTGVGRPFGMLRCWDG